jgi:hypothetical protein
MALCPSLHTLDLHRYNCSDALNGARAFIPPAGEKLRTITIAECHGGEARLEFMAVPSLRNPFFPLQLHVPLSLYILPSEGRRAHRSLHLHC